MPSAWQIECLLTRIQSLRSEIDRVKQKDHPYPEPDTIYNALLAVIESRQKHFVEALARYHADEKGRRKLQSAFESTEEQLRLIFGFFSRVDRVDSPRIPFEILRALSWVAKFLLHETAQAVVRLDPRYNYSISSCRQEFEAKGWEDCWPRENKETNTPSTVLLIGFPSPEAGSILVHALAAHEFGHQYCDKFKSRIKLVREEVTANVKKLHSQDLLEYQKELKDRGTWGSDETNTRRIVVSLDNVAKNWLNEVFSDLVATRLVGPAFLAAFDRILLGDSQNSDSHPNGRLRRALVREYLTKRLPQIVEDPVWESLFSESQRNLTSADLIERLGEEICRGSLDRLAEILDTENIPSPLENIPPPLDNMSSPPENVFSPPMDRDGLPDLVKEMESHIDNLSPPSAALEEDDVIADGHKFWLVMYVAWHFRLDETRFRNFTSSHGWTDDKESTATKKAEDALGNLILHALQSLELRFRWKEKYSLPEGIRDGA